MKPDCEKRIAELVKQIESENDHAKLMLLLEELNQFLGDWEAQRAVVRAGRAAGSTK